MSLILISGSNGSGKSLFAEQLIAKTSGKRYYIATMKAQTEDNVQRIHKHRLQREHLNFETLEVPFQVGSIDLAKDSVVLLEDVSNLWANAMFEHHVKTEAVMEEIRHLLSRCETLVAVTISGLCDEGYDEETSAYIQGLNQLNQQLFALADSVYSMKDQQPVCLKGEPHGRS